MPSLAKHMLLYVYLGFALPRFVHLPLLCSSSRAKLSKRTAQAGLSGLINLGFLPKAVLDYLISLIVSRECNSIEEAIGYFDFQKSRSASVCVNWRKLVGTNRRLLNAVVFGADDLLTSSLTVKDTRLVLKLCAQKASVVGEVYKLAGFVF